MDAQFEPGSLVRHKGTGLEWVVDGNEEAGKVRCSCLKGIARLTTYYPETDLERIPLIDPAGGLAR
jgi:hypothetical protein